MESLVCEAGWHQAVGGLPPPQHTILPHITLLLHCNG
jgi:hypothetical protein